jgi:hypothetical protein
MPKMSVLIDSQKVVELEYEVIASEGDDYIVIDIDNVNTLLFAWVELDPSKRMFSWPAKRDEEDMIVAWYADSAGLVHQWVSPFWDGHYEYEAHSLEAIDEALPVGALAWGTAIQESDPKENR